MPNEQNMIDLICDVFNHSPEELEDWSYENIYNAYLSAQKIIDDFED